MAVAAANDQGQGRKFDVTPGATLFQHHGVDMPLDVIDAEERNPQGSGKALGVSDAHQERPYEPRAAGHADSTKVAVTDVGSAERFAHYGNDRSQVLAGCQFRHHASIGAMDIELRGDDVREQAVAIRYHGRRGLVAGRLDAEQVHLDRWPPRAREPAVAGRRRSAYWECAGSLTRNGAQPVHRSSFPVLARTGIRNVRMGASAVGHPASKKRTTSDTVVHSLDHLLPPVMSLG